MELRTEGDLTETYHVLRGKTGWKLRGLHCWGVFSTRGIISVTLDGDKQEPLQKPASLWNSLRKPNHCAYSRLGREIFSLCEVWGPWGTSRKMEQRLCSAKVQSY